MGLGILGRNLQVLGKLLIARGEPKCEAGQSQRAAPRPELVGPAPKTWWNHGIDTVVIGNYADICAY